jgi:hypothetical protein
MERYGPGLYSGLHVTAQGMLAGRSAIVYFGHDAHVSQKKH